MILGISVKGDVNGFECVVQQIGMTIRQSSVCNDSKFKSHPVQVLSEFVETGIQKRFPSPENNLRTRSQVPNLLRNGNPFFIGKLLPVFPLEHTILLPAENAFQVTTAGQLKMHGNDFRKKHKPYLDY